MFPILQCELGQRIMRIRGCGHNNHVYRRILHHVLGGPVGLDTRVVIFCVIVGFGGALDYGVQVQFGDLLDEGDVESFGAEAVADDTYVGRHCGD